MYRRRIKRRRYHGGGPKRPIDKSIVSLDYSIVSGAGTSFALYPVGGTAVVYPGTIVGIKWSFRYGHSATADTPTAITWVIIRQRQGVAPSPISSANASSLYNPEQDVICCGQGIVQNAGLTYNPNQDAGSTKAMRKLAVGDALVFGARCDVIGGGAARNGLVNGYVQFFTKG